jgi:hypothetical protein
MVDWWVAGSLWLGKNLNTYIVNFKHQLGLVTCCYLQLKRKCSSINLPKVSNDEKMHANV